MDIISKSTSLLAPCMSSALVIPHEVLAVILLTLGIFIFSREEKHDKWWSGLIGGVITLLSINFAVYYAFSLLVYSLARAIKTKNYKFHIIRLIITGVMTFLISSIYLVPYLSSVLKHGSDNFQWVWTIMSNFDPYLVTFGLGFIGLTFILGVLGIITLPKSNFKLILIITLVVLYIGRFHVYITKPLFNMSYIPDHAYYALVFFLSFTGGIFLRDFPIKIIFKKWTLERLKMGHIFLASTFFLPILIWNPISNGGILNEFKPIPEKIENIASVINDKTTKDDILLSSNELSPWILLLTGRHLALSGSPWCSNPSARYTLRYNDFEKAFTSKDIKRIKEILNKWAVDILIFSKEKNEWFFGQTNPKFGRLRSYRGIRLQIDKKTFGDNKHFKKIFEDEYYVILEVMG